MAAGETTRRSLLIAAAVTVAGGIAGYVVASNSDAAKTTSSSASNGYGPAAGGGTPLTAANSVPAGGGVVVDSANVVVTRDQSGTLHAFSATCTHQGCTVNDVSNGVIGCPCHGSQFNADTGAVVTGPASRPLPPVAVVVRGDEVFTS